MTPRSGYTLPVFACAAAVAALRHLQRENSLTQAERAFVEIDLLDPPQRVEIPIEQVAQIGEGKALAVTRSDPGDNLDLTRNTPVWAIAELSPREPGEAPVAILGGEGVGKQSNGAGEAAIYRYARQLFQENLQPRLTPQERVTVTIVLPQGRELAERTSNAAFGVVDGLSLLGTTGISQPLSAPGQLAIYREELAAKAGKFEALAFCIGENGLDLAQKLGIEGDRLVKTANWLGPMLVEAGVLGLRSILLLGYHGKLIKLAGGIFHTHHHIADGRLEILTAYCANLGLSTEVLQQVFRSPTAEAALQRLRSLKPESKVNHPAEKTVDRVYFTLASAIDRQAQDYIRKHAQQELQIGSILFDRDRTIIVKSPHGTALLKKMCYHTQNN